MVVGTQIERTPGDNATCTRGNSEYLGVCWLSATAAVGNKEVRWGGSKREVLGCISLSGRGTGALTERLPLELIEVRLKAGEPLLCGTCTGGNKLYFDCPGVCFASTSDRRERMWSRSELCPSICVSVRWSASGGGSG